jgi:transcriptional regulator with GAF, ATPase, and Fis domain
MLDDQARAALIIIEALERVGWRIYLAAPLLGYRRARSVGEYIDQLGMQPLVARMRRADWQHNAAIRAHGRCGEPSLVERLRADGDDETARAILLDAIRVRRGNVARAARDLGMPESSCRLYVNRLARCELTAIRRSRDADPKAAHVWMEQWCKPRRKSRWMSNTERPAG